MEPTPISPTKRALQRRTLRVLLAAQVLAALGGSAAAAGALLALTVSGRESLASLPLAFLVVGSSVSVVPISALSRRAGRRIGLSLALAIAAAGAAAIIVAGAVNSLALLCLANAAFGVGNTAVLLARYAAADLSTPERRARDIGYVVFAATFGGVAGPNLLDPAGRIAAALGLPELTGLYLVAAGSFALAALILFALLRPDPLHTAIALGERDERVLAAATPPIAPGVPLRFLFANRAAATGLATMVVANFVMVAVMTMAPVHMRGEGYGLEFVGVVVSLHVAGMFAPSPITGWLTDRIGSPPIAAVCGLLLMIAGIVSAVSTHSGPTFAAGLVLLGIGWNAGLIGGSTLLASAVPAAQRPRAEGAGDLSMGVAAAVATALAGPVVGVAGYATLALIGAAAGATLTPVLSAAARTPAAAGSVPAKRLIA